MAHQHTKEQIQTKFEAIYKTLNRVNHLARWHQLYDISAGVENARQMIEQIEREFGDDNDTERHS